MQVNKPDNKIIHFGTEEFFHIADKGLIVIFFTVQDPGIGIQSADPYEWIDSWKKEIIAEVKEGVDFIAYVNEDIVVDNDLVTTRTGGYCHLFARTMIELLKKKEHKNDICFIFSYRSYLQWSGKNSNVLH